MNLTVSKNIVIGLSLLIAFLAALAAATGLFSKENGASFTVSTLHGQTAQILGHGLYRYDTVFFGTGFRGQDAVALFLGVPLLLIAVYLYQRGSVGGHLLLTGILGYFLYAYASLALGAAYNRLFLLYIVLFSASLFAFIQAFSSVNLGLIVSRLPDGLPRRGLSIFMFTGAVVTLIVWGAPLVSALLHGAPPDRMDSYTTMVTYALDLAIIPPASMLCAVLVWRGEPLGYVIASPLLVLIVLLAPTIVLTTIFQRAAGIPLTPGEMIGPVSGFVVLGLIAIWLLTAILRGVTRIT